MKIHELKTHSIYYNEVFMGHKNFEIRLNDRNFKKGDKLILKEYDPKTCNYTGNKLVRTVMYILDGGQFGLEKGYVAMSIG